LIAHPVFEGGAAVAQVSPSPFLRNGDAHDSFLIEVRRRHRRHRRIRHTPDHNEQNQRQNESPPEQGQKLPAAPTPQEPKTPLKQPEPAAPEQSQKLEKDTAQPAKDASKPPELPAVPYGPPPPPETWTAAEIEAGRVDCERRLSGLHIIYSKLDPIREGACGLPAPIRLRGFESELAPRLGFEPAPTISCKMSAALRRWFDGVVQPKAKQYLNATIIQMTNLSAYVCRTRYDNPLQRISQHAYGNALDVSEFITAKGEHVSVLEHWNSGDERQAFLHDVHDGACQIFGTTLGPEANAAHKNHFHLDMMERRHPLCDFTPSQVRKKREDEERERLAAAAAAKAKNAPWSGKVSAAVPAQKIKPEEVKPEEGVASSRPQPRHAAETKRQAEQTSLRRVKRKHHHRRRYSY
jgi:hypothetical protein